MTGSSGSAGASRVLSPQQSTDLATALSRVRNITSTDRTRVNNILHNILSNSKIDAKVIDEFIEKMKKSTVHGTFDLKNQSSRDAFEVMLREMKFTEFATRDLRAGEQITSGTVGAPVTIHGVATTDKPRDFDFDKLEASGKITQHYELEVGGERVLKIGKDALNPLISAINHAGSKATDTIEVATSKFRPRVGIPSAKITAVAYADFPVGVKQGGRTIEFEGDGKGFVQNL